MKNLMSKSSILLLALSLSSFTFAQEESAKKSYTASHNKEVGLRGTSISNLNFVFAKYRGANKILRIRAGNFRSSYGSNQDQYRVNFGVAIGFQRYISIDEKFSFFHGFEPSIYMSANKMDVVNNNSTSRSALASISLGYMLGFNYDINSKLKVYAEMLPSLGASYNYNKNGNNSSTDFITEFNFTSNLLSLGIHYKF